MPPGTAKGTAVNRKTQRFRFAASLPRSSRSHSSNRGRPAVTERATGHNQLLASLYSTNAIWKTSAEKRPAETLGFSIYGSPISSPGRHGFPH